MSWVSMKIIHCCVPVRWGSSNINLRALIQGPTATWCEQNLIEPPPGVWKSDALPTRPWYNLTCWHVYKSTLTLYFIDSIFFIRIFLRSERLSPHDQSLGYSPWPFTVQLWQLKSQSHCQNLPPSRVPPINPSSSQQCQSSKPTAQSASSKHSY